MPQYLCPKCYRPVREAQDPLRICDSCDWSGDFTKTITEYSVLHLDVNKIYSDGEFNCRGSILPMDIVDLVQDIERNGLQFPIAVQPRQDVTTELPEGFDFRIIAGHRRFAAFQLMKKAEIPAMVKVGLSEVQARLVNLGENLKRKALNILQEAISIKRLRDLGLNRRQVSEELGVSVSWVQVRFNLLDLPDEVQQEAAAGILNQYQVKEIFSLPTTEQQFEAVKKIKDAKLRGERGVSVGKTPLTDPNKKKRHAKNVVQEMMTHMGQTIGFGLHTRALAWANGEISSTELFLDIAAYAKEKGVDYEIPVKV
jgi:ParB/RepB/Spo0J family partition protein